MIGNFFSELRRRRVFQTITLYVVGAWLFIQVADVLFPAWEIPETAKQFLVIGAIIGAPLALIFGWRFDITSHGIKRTPAAGQDEVALDRSDAAILSVLCLLSIGILAWMTIRIASLEHSVEPIQTANIRQGSIAVLPFDNISNDPENDYFCDGISEELLIRLGEYRDLHVLGRQSSFRFKDSGLQNTRISEILGVQYLLQGSVRKAGDDLRISARLIDRSGFQVWEESYDRRLTGIFEIQDEIAAAVAGSLAAVVSSDPVRLRTYLPSLDAYQYFLAGRELVRRRSVNWLDESEQLFLRAIEADPDYPQPYAGIAQTKLLRRDSMDQAAVFAEAQGFIDKALDLDPDLPEAHAAQGLLLTLERPARNVQAEDALRKAISLDPGVVGARNWLALALAGQDKHAEARRERELALELDPLDTINSVNVGLSYSSSGQFDLAERQFKRLLDVPGLEATAYANLSAIYQNHGRYDQMIEAVKSYSLIMAAENGAPKTYWLSTGYASLGMWDKAERLHRREVELSGENLGTQFQELYFLKLQGRLEEIWPLYESIMQGRNLTADQLPLWAAQIVGAAHIASGRTEDGVAILERTLDLTQPMRTSQGGGTFGLSFVNALAWGYRQIGQTDRSNEATGYVIDQLRTWEEAGFGSSPDSSYENATALLIQGETNAALELLEAAIEKGYRDYYFIWNDQFWAGMRQNPRFLELMSRIKQDVDAMVERVRQADASDGFEQDLSQAAASAQL